ncbi:nuclear transport factor 2 family protein [uncultured Kiloniella sp.]|uniref:nuclear transport factor 2 family protein n=1 Tax=uncultured Kiloniella sp. TaxID=1133091 RepID=UPI002606E625|nr:nuclear transport factor 2 family protein [uncultured Kiloniella sp.]
MSKDYQAVVNTIQVYFDGLFHSDTERLAQVFHPKAHYVCATDDPLLYLTMDEYFPIVDKRPSPASRGEARQDQILSIRFAGDNTAFVHLNCAIGEKFFTDFLTLILVDGRWQVISKVFDFDIKKLS